MMWNRTQGRGGAETWRRRACRGADRLVHVVHGSVARIALCNSSAPPYLRGSFDLRDPSAALRLSGQFYRTMKFLPLAVILLFTSCEKDITVDLPQVPQQLVVDGHIEQGQRPFVVITRTQGYFAPTDINSISNMFVNGAVVTVTSDGVVWNLTQVCGSALEPASLADAATATGFSPALLSLGNFCVYTTTAPGDTGVIGRTYRLDISAEGKTLSAVSTLPNPVPLDSVWFKLALLTAGDDSLGSAWARITDPDTIGNGYRWMAQRINHRANGAIKDPYYISPLGSTYNDKYINGLTFDFTENRGQQFFAGNAEDDNAEKGYFKVGDTIAVKALSIGRKEYDFYSSYDTNVGALGDLFSTPANVMSNITGGLGIWAGRGVYLDTIICVP